MLKEEQLHSYQDDAIDHIIETPYAGLFLEMGLGKTVSALTAIEFLIYQELEIEKVLVIAPKRVAESVWTKEIVKWEHLTHLKTSRVIGTERQRINALKDDADIYLLGRDNVAWLCGYYGTKLPFDMWVVDESSSFKNHDSKRFKALKRRRTSAKRIVLLTGTPAPNGLLDLWAQIYLLDGGERLGKFITHYRKDYFNEGRKNGNIVYNYNIQDTGEERIYDRIGDICLSMKAEDYLKDLPGKVINDVQITFTKKLEKTYKDFEKEKVLEYLESQEEGVDDAITAANAAALMNKLLQFANGAVYDEEKVYHNVHNLKIWALEEIVEQAQGKPVLVAWTYRHDRDRIMKHFRKLKPVQMKTDQDIDDWNAGKIKLMLMHPASGGHGLNLQYGGNTAVWFGQTWSLELYQQFNARLARQGQKQVTVIHRLVVEGTVDIDVVAALERKDGEQENLMQAVKAKIEKYTQLNRRRQTR